MRRFLRRVRRVLAIIGAVLGVILLVLGVGFAVTYTGAQQTATDGADFDRPLAVPPLLEPTVGSDGVKRFAVRLQTGQTELLPGKRTDTWGINGSYLGPTLRARKGDKVAVDVRNTLPEATTIHWHGMHLPPEMDGGPHQRIEKDTTWSPAWTVTQPAATLWYHPHLHGVTQDHVYKGLAGMFLLDDDEADRLSLPREYGVDDVPLVLQDKRIDDDGTLQGTPFFVDKVLVGGPVGFVGDKLFVNGTHRPVFTAKTEKVRFRVLNGSNGRHFNLGFADDRRFHLVATDNGLVERPVELDRLLLSPGERAEIVVDVRDADSLVLRNFPVDLGVAFPGNRLAGADDTMDVLKVAVPDGLRSSPALPDRLSTRTLPDPPAGAPERDIQLAGQSYVNGKTMDMSRVDEVMTVGSTEVWKVSADEMPHNLHIHGVTMKVLDVDGAPPPVSDRGPKDTVRLKPGATTRVAVYAPGYADEKHPYMYHCHVLFHEDAGMMAQFLSVEPGREDAVSRTLGDVHSHGEAAN